jgi:hypothetical protein
MNRETKDTLLKLALTAFGVVFILIYPLGMIWPSGWVWHGGQGKYYLQMICGVYAVLGVFLIAAARNPSAHRSLILFTVWSSVVHAAIMAAQALSDGHELGHLAGDVPALLLVVGALWYLLPDSREEELPASRRAVGALTVGPQKA